MLAEFRYQRQTPERIKSEPQWVSSKWVRQSGAPGGRLCGAGRWQISQFSHTHRIAACNIQVDFS